MNRDRMMSKSKSLTVASAIPISTSPFEWAGTVYPRAGSAKLWGAVAVGDQVENMRRAIWSVSLHCRQL